jgi:predicted GIY-YIG superfamily endonuclease
LRLFFFRPVSYRDIFQDQCARPGALHTVSQTHLLTRCHPEEVQAFAARRAADEGSMYSSPSFYYLRLRMTNRSKTLYTGVIGNLEKRVFEHKQGIKGNSLRATRSTGWCILSVLGISALRSLARNRSKDLHESRKWH